MITLENLYYNAKYDDEAERVLNFMVSANIEHARPMPERAELNTIVAGLTSNPKVAVKKAPRFTLKDALAEAQAIREAEAADQSEDSVVTTGESRNVHEAYQHRFAHERGDLLCGPGPNAMRDVFMGDQSNVDLVTRDEAAQQDRTASPKLHGMQSSGVSGSIATRGSNIMKQDIFGMFNFDSMDVDGLDDMFSQAEDDFDSDFDEMEEGEIKDQIVDELDLPMSEYARLLVKGCPSLDFRGIHIPQHVEDDGSDIYVSLQELEQTASGRQGPFDHSNPRAARVHPSRENVALSVNHHRQQPKAGSIFQSAVRRVGSAQAQRQVSGNAPKRSSSFPHPSSSIARHGQQMQPAQHISNLQQASQNTIASPFTNDVDMRQIGQTPQVTRPVKSCSHPQMNQSVQSDQVVDLQKVSAQHPGQMRMPSRTAAQQPARGSLFSVQGAHITTQVSNQELSPLFQSRMAVNNGFLPPSGIPRDGYRNVTASQQVPWTSSNRSSSPMVPARQPLNAAQHILQLRSQSANMPLSGAMSFNRASSLGLFPGVAAANSARQCSPDSVRANSSQSDHQAQQWPVPDALKSLIQSQPSTIESSAQPSPVKEDSSQRNNDAGSYFPDAFAIRH